MVAFVLEAIAGGAALGLIWMALTGPSIFAYRSMAGTGQMLGRTTRDAWVVAYILGVTSYGLLRLSGLITH